MLLLAKILGWRILIGFLDLKRSDFSRRVVFASSKQIICALLSYGGCGGGGGCGSC